MTEEWWILRDNSMSDRTYTRSELMHLEDFGPTTSVCRTDSNQWVEARNDPALSSLFGGISSDSTPEVIESEQDENLQYVPRYNRALAFIIDVGLFVPFVLLFNYVLVSQPYSRFEVVLFCFLFGAVYFPLFESDLLDRTTVGKTILGLKVVDLDRDRFSVVQSFIRYSLMALPFVLLAFAFEPNLPHVTSVWVTSLVFAGLGGGLLLSNSFLFFSNNPTYRLLHDYAFGAWVLPEATAVEPGMDSVRTGVVFRLFLIGLVGFGLSFVGGYYFWILKEPPLVQVPSECSQNRFLRLFEKKKLPDRNTLETMLLKGDFGRVESRLETLRNRYKQGALNDAYLNYAFNTFSRMNGTLGRRVNEWVVRNPESPYGLLARAKFYLRRASVLRSLEGPGLGGDTPGFRPGQGDLKQARLSAGKALKIDTGLSITYATLIRIDSLQSTQSASRRLLERADRLVPPSFAVWKVHFMRSGSSDNSIGKRLNRVSDFVQSHETFNLFCGFPARRKGEMLRSRGDHSTADKYYSQALRYGQAPWLYRDRGTNAVRSGRLTEGVNHFSDYLELVPRQPDVLRKKADSLYELGKYSKSIDALNKALDLEPRNPRLLLLHARILHRVGKTRRALERLEVARGIAPWWRPLREARIKYGKGLQRVPEAEKSDW